MRTRQFHALLRNEAREQRVERLHDVAVTVDIEWAGLLDRMHALFLDVAGDDPRERASKVRSEAMRRLVAMQVEGSHRRMRRLERQLEFELDMQRPIEEECALAFESVDAYALDALANLARNLARVVDDDRVELGHLVA